jgi:hypothetical protein
MREFASMAARAMSCIVLLIALADAPVAAEPSPEQVAAIKANCRSDYMSYCWSVPRGGPEAAQCLKQNLAKLSPACQQAVKAATATAAPPSAPAPAKQESGPAPLAEPSPEPAATTAAPASPKAPPSVEEPKPESSTTATSEPAAQAPPAPKAAAKVPAKPAAPAPSAATPSTPPAQAKTEQPPAEQPSAEGAATEAGPVIIGVIPPRKKLMIFKSCRRDLDAFCAGVSYGEGRQLHCLFSNQASLSPDCQGALAKLTR